MNRFAVPILTALFLAMRATADRPAIGQPEASSVRSLTAAHVEALVKNSVKRDPGDASHPGTAVFYAIQCRKPADHVAVTVGADTTIFTVTSPSGIGSASIGRTGPAWPASVILRLDLKGLEEIVTMKVGNKKRRIGV